MNDMWRRVNGNNSSKPPMLDGITTGQLSARTVHCIAVVNKDER